MKIAIVGMACTFPGAPDLASYFNNLTRGVDAISAIPPARIDPESFSEESRAESGFYCARGGFIDEYAQFDALAFNIMPVAARGAEPDQLLALQVATSALADAGYATRSFARDRTAVILGRGGYSTAVRTRLDYSLRGAEQLDAALKALLPSLDRATRDKVRKELRAQIDAPGPDSVIGIVPNLTASRIAHRLDLHGPAWTIDAACASSLIAVEQGCRELMGGRVDMVLAGGVHLCLSDGFWSVFSRLGALSKTEQMRPFDRRADGLLIGEGLGVIVLKRLEDAERDQDCIYAVLRGMGSSSDGRGATLLSPSVEGQVIALERAWREAGLDPLSVGMVEAHGTATNAGDLAELTTLARVFGPKSPGDAPVVGSVKSMIGHAMPAAGAAGLIKAALAVHHGVRFPTLHCEEPNPGLNNTRFRVIDKAEPWETGEQPRLAGVNAFGFGGINSHAVLEQHKPGRTRVMVSTFQRERGPLEERVALFSAPTVAALVDAVAGGQEGAQNGPVRAALFDPTPERLKRLQEVVERGKAWRGRDALWFSPDGLLSQGGKLALLFPGIGASFEPRVEDVARHFNIPMPPLVKPNTIEEQGFMVVQLNRMMHTLLSELGVKGDLFAGHSIGEWSAMMASGAMSETDREALMESLEPGTAPLLDLVFAAAGCDVSKARAALEGLQDVVVSHDNCPHQILLCGLHGPIDVAMARLQKLGVMCQKLPFQSGFHTPFFQIHAERFRAQFARLPLREPQIPFWSATTCAPYPRDVQGIRDLSLRHMLEPVRFRELTQRLYEENVRVFVQVGVGTLHNFAEDTLRGQAHLALSATVSDRSGLSQLRRLLASLYIEGADGLHFDRLTPRPKGTMTLALGVPVVSQFTPLQLTANSGEKVSTDISSTPLAAEFDSTLRAMEAAQRQVLALMERQPGRAPAAQPAQPTGPASWTAPLSLTVHSHPFLMDHSLFPQRPGWPTLSDWFPVVPLTMLIDLAMEYAVARFPGHVAIAVENMRALRWFEVLSASNAQVKCSYDGKDRVEVHVGENVTCTVVIAREYPPAPAADVGPFQPQRPATFKAEDIYPRGLMFHGPAYQGITAISGIAADGMRGTIKVPTGRASLLDNAGQLLGLWIQQRFEDNRMAFPVGAKCIRFFGPEPKVGEDVQCTLRILADNDKAVFTNMQLAHQGRAWVEVENWEDRRFETNGRLWSTVCDPTHELLAVPHEEGFLMMDDTFRMATTRAQLAGRFLREAERDTISTMKNPALQRSWLSGRIAAKDAARDLLFKAGRYADLFPAEVGIVEDAQGKLTASVHEGPTLHVAIDQRSSLTVAVAAEEPVGIAIERVALPATDPHRVTEQEHRLALGTAADEAWATLWAAKRAAAKAQPGKDVDPTTQKVRDRAGDRLLVGSTWVRTKRCGESVVAWTVKS